MGFLDNMLSSLTGGQQNNQQNGQQGGQSTGFFDGILSSLTGEQQNSRQNNQQGGQSGGAAFAKMLKNSLGLGTPQEMPGKLCFVDCPLNGGEHCAGCLKEQEEILAAVDRLEKLEITVENANSAPQAAMPKPVKCSLCGAPIETGGQACPYCDTPYPAEALMPEIPGSKREQQQLLLQKSTETYKIVSDWTLRIMDLQKGSYSGVFGGLVQMMAPSVNSMVEMNEEQIQQGAEHYGVSYVEYVSGILKKKYQTAWGIQNEERIKQDEENANRRRAEMAQREQEYQAKRAKIDADIAARNRSLEERRARDAASRKELTDLQATLAASKAPQYSGGGTGGVSSRCCGNCKHYMAADNKCALREYYEWQPRSASDSCNQGYSPK